jgi:hypothetical protein
LLGGCSGGLSGGSAGNQDNTPDSADPTYKGTIDYPIPGGIPNPNRTGSTITGNTDGNGVDLVFMAEGFLESELPLFIDAVNRFMSEFLTGGRLFDYDSASRVPASRAA